MKLVKTTQLEVNSWNEEQIGFVFYTEFGNFQIVIGTQTNVLKVYKIK